MIDLKPKPNVFASLASKEENAEDHARHKQITQRFFALCAGIFVFFLLWGSIGTLDIASMATGEVIPSSKVKSIQHLEGGIVRKILVREGQVVTKGQPLVQLEQTVSAADVAELKVRITKLEIEIARLEAESQSAAEPVFSDEMIKTSPNIIAQSMDLFHARRQDLENRIAAQREAIVRREHDIGEIAARLNNLREALRLHDEKVQISEELLKEEVTTRYSHLDLLSQANELRGSIAETRSALAAAQAALKEEQANLNQVTTAHLNDIQSQLEDSRGEYRELRERLIKFTDSLERTVLRSSVDGIIKTLYIVTEGGVIKPGEPIVDIVPEGDRLVVEAQLPPHDIGYVQAGQEAAIKLASADAARFQAINGEVVSISPDTLLTPDGMPYYKVRIETERSYFERGTVRYLLYPGMQVVANIKIGTRSVFEYIFSPVISGLDDALQER